MGICMVLPKELEDKWSHKQSIAEVETVPIVVALLEWSKLFEGRDVIWWEDNAVALAAMVRGGSDSIEVDRSAAVVSLASAHLRTRIWFESSSRRLIGQMASRECCSLTPS